MRVGVRGWGWDSEARDGGESEIGDEGGGEGERVRVGMEVRVRLGVRGWGWDSDARDGGEGEVGDEDGGEGEVGGERVRVR